MITVGRLCIKTAGRDAGKKCVVVDQLDKSYALIDGETRRRKCNISHLEPLPQTVEISQGASHDEVSRVFKLLGIELVVKRAQPKEEAKPRPRPVRAQQRKAMAPKSQEKQKPKAAASKLPAAKPAVKETKLEKAASRQ
ncbi:50S ribosomal protein L14e [Candidatus Woesearchaeota archaeon]|nr:50S ribosomal protein L14e [Candidatus Woesearchaeota archaeon]